MLNVVGTYDWDDVVGTRYLLLKIIYLVKLGISVFVINNNIHFWFIEFFIKFCGIILCHTWHQFAFIDCVHNVGFAVIRIYFHLFTHIKEVQIVDVFVRRRYLRLRIHMHFHIPFNLRLLQLIPFIWKVEAEIGVIEVVWHFQIASKTFIRCIFLRQVPNARNGHFSGSHFVFNLCGPAASPSPHARTTTMVINSGAIIIGYQLKVIWLSLRKHLPIFVFFVVRPPISLLLHMMHIWFGAFSSGGC